jgi:hypothetical protein
MSKFLILLLSFSYQLLAHDGGHGPKLKEQSLYGGKLAGVILEKDEEKGHHAKIEYKAELIHQSRDNVVKLYLYDQKLKKVDISKIKTPIKAIQYEKKKKKNFTLKLDKSGKFFIGSRPKNKRVPFEIEVYFNDGKNNLMAGFEKLD